MNLPSETRDFILKAVLIGTLTFAGAGSGALLEYVGLQEGNQENHELVATVHELAEEEAQLTTANRELEAVMKQISENWPAPPHTNIVRQASN